jgi:regulator of extracellular matrix RemA (YlzA/DUF370 family)
MARKLVGVGYGSLVNGQRIVAVLNPAGQGIRRLRSEAKKRGLIVDATQGRKTRAVVLLDTGHLLLSAVQPETLAIRLEKGEGLPEAEGEALP